LRYVVKALIGLLALPAVIAAATGPLATWPAAEDDEEAVRTWIIALGKAPAIAQSNTFPRPGVPSRHTGIGQAIGRPISAVMLSDTPVTDADLKKLVGLKRLEVLNLSSTDVTDAGLKELSECGSLVGLNLDHTKVTDAGIKHLAGLKKIKNLDLSWTAVTDVGLLELAALDNLQQLNLERTKVSDAGVKQLARIKKLNSLVLDRPKLTDGMLRTLREAGLLHTLADAEVAFDPKVPIKRPARPEDVVRLNLVGAPLTDAGLKEVAGLKNLEWLDLRGTTAGRTAAGLMELAGLKKLNNLVLDESQITDEVLRGLRAAGILHTLSRASGTPGTDPRPTGAEDVLRLFLNMTPVSDAGLKELADFKNLQYLSLGSTRVTDAGLKELAGFKNLEYLDLSATRVTDAGLKELAGLKKLRDLRLVGTGVTNAGLRALAGLKGRADPEVTAGQLLISSPGVGLPSAYQIFRINADGSGRTQLTVGEEGAIDPALSPDGKRIAFVSDARLYVMNSDGTGRKSLADRADTATVAPSWSPDGKQIAFGVYFRGPTGGTFRSRLYVVDADGRNLRQVGDIGGLCAGWSPDRKRLLVTRMGDNGGLSVMDVDGTNVRELVKGAAMGAWSPDGQSLAYVLRGRRSGGLYVARADGSNPRRVRASSDNDVVLAPQWSADGKRLFFTQQARGAAAAVCAIDVDGRSFRQVTVGSTPAYLGGACVLTGFFSP
jgi:Leucine-rich repeat (LRR) protein